MTIKLTREEAIQDLKAIKSFERYARGRLALDIAIEALKGAEINCVHCPRYFETEDETGVYSHCEDLISRAEAIEAIEIVDWYHQDRNKDMVHGANDDEHQAWYKAEDVYKALEAVPSADRPKDGDLISRTEAIEALGEEPPVWCDEDYEIAERDQWRANIEAIKSVPSADRPRGDLNLLCALAGRACPFQGKEFSWCLTCPHINEEDRVLMKKAVAKPKTGKWINTSPSYRSDNIICDQCGYNSIARYNFCPNCGADMRGE